MLFTMSRVASRRHPRLRHAAATALFALVSSPSSAFVASTSSFVLRQNSVSTSSFDGQNSNVAFRFRGGSQNTISTTTTTSVTMTATTTEDTASSTTMTPASKLEALRQKMKELNLDVYLIPSDDPHLSGKYCAVQY
jgi:hypothetical protein